MRVDGGTLQRGTLAGAIDSCFPSALGSPEGRFGRDRRGHSLHVVFFGNCQVQVLAAIIRRFVSPYISLTLDCIDTYHPATQGSRELLAKADLVVAQRSLNPPPSYSDLGLVVPARQHIVPLVNGSFLYPYQGLPHPLTPKARYGNPPYPPEYNDRFLSKLINAGTLPEAALALYRHHDVAGTCRVARLFELACESQRELDAQTGYGCADLIETYLPEEQMFQSAFHYGGRIARHIAATLCDRIGFPHKFGQRIRDHLTEAPFMARFVPVHPSVARHFGMKWANATTRYEYMWEGSFTFDEYVVRFMEARWNPMLQEGVIDARRDDPGARSKLEAGLIVSPNSAVGLHELSRIVEREGDIESSIVLQQRAVASGSNPNFAMRLGKLFRAAGSVDDARHAFAHATELDPVSPTAWALLRDALFAQGFFHEAVAAAERAVEFDVDTQAAQAALERVGNAVRATSPS